MADEYVPGAQFGHYRVATVGQRRFFVHACAVTGKVDGYTLVAERFQLRDGPLPAPRGVKTAVHENKTH